MAPRVFLITGTSSGLGLEYVKAVLRNGDIAVATARKPESLKFDGTNEKNYLALPLDVTSQSAIDSAFSKAIEQFGRIDVLVNNAGYGLGGEFESYADEQIRKQMEVNFFGLVNVTRAGMKTMREQKPQGGVVQQITSIGGQTGVPLVSIYCASKWAVEGFTEAISKEVEPSWNIKFTCVEPGGFRTDWAGRSIEFGANKHPAYEHVDVEKEMNEWDGKQIGDPRKAAEKMYELATMQDPPLRCVVGSDAFKAMGEKLERYGNDLKRFEALSTGTDADEQ